MTGPAGGIRNGAGRCPPLPAGPAYSTLSVTRLTAAASTSSG